MSKVKSTMSSCSNCSTSSSDMKYILVTGGVISGIGKGIISSSLGTLLKASGLRVTSIKIDPYINIDAGTFSPYEHGEVFVLDDGGEVDLDLGNYERFLDITLTRDNNITTGKIYQQVIKRERKGDYLGKTVQVVPHITDAIQEWVKRVSLVPVDESGEIPQVAIVELGGVIGDIESMPFVEAFRQFQFNVGRGNFCCIHVSLVPSPSTTGEHKTKPTQMSVSTLRGAGLSPDLLMCRCTSPMPKAAVDKLSMFCHVPTNHVICVEDVNSLFRIPLLLSKQKVHEIVCRHFNIKPPNTKPRKSLHIWQELADRSQQCSQEVKIALVGKYVQLSDSYASVYKALTHAALHCNRRLTVEAICSEDLEDDCQRNNPGRYHQAWRQLCMCHGVLIPGGFGSRGCEGKMVAIKWCREQLIPLLGVCLGMQLTVVEFARNVLNWKDADSTEINANTNHPVVIDMPEHNPGEMGGTMRLGSRTTYFQDNQKAHSILHRLYGLKNEIHERHRHRYEVNPAFVEEFEKAGMQFVGRDDSGKRMEQLELAKHPYLVGVQYHPEYLSRPTKPSPPYVGLILAASGQLMQFLKNRGRVARRHWSFIEDSEEETDKTPNGQDVHALVREVEALILKEESVVKSKSSSSQTISGGEDGAGGIISCNGSGASGEVSSGVGGGGIVTFGNGNGIGEVYSSSSQEAINENSIQ